MRVLLADGVALAGLESSVEDIVGENKEGADPWRAVVERLGDVNGERAS